MKARLAGAWSALGDGDVAGALLVVAVALGLGTPMLASSLLVTKKFRGIDESASATPHVVALVTTLGNVAIVAVALAVLVRHLRGLRTAALPAAVLAAAWLVCFGGLVSSGAPVDRSIVLLPAIGLALLASSPGQRARRALGWVTVTFALVSLTLGALVPSAGRYVRPEALSDDKPVWGLGILAGILPSGNNLGVALAVGLPAVALLGRRWRVAGVAVGLVAVFCTFSRTAWAAVAVAALAWAVVAVAGRSIGPRAARRVAGGGLGVLGVAALLIPLTARSHGAYNNRGGLWGHAFDVWRERPLLGWGPAYYEQIAGTARGQGSFAYHAHNEGLHLLVTGGVVLLVLAVALVALAAFLATREAGEGRPWGAATLAAFLVAAMLEVPLGFVDRSMYYPTVVVPLLLVLALTWRTPRTP